MILHNNDANNETERKWTRKRTKLSTKRGNWWNRTKSSSILILRHDVDRIHVMLHQNAWMSATDKSRLPISKVRMTSPSGHGENNEHMFINESLTLKKSYRLIPNSSAGAFKSQSNCMNPLPGAEALWKQDIQRVPGPRPSRWIKRCKVQGTMPCKSNTFQCTYFSRVLPAHFEILQVNVSLLLPLPDFQSPPQEYIYLFTSLCSLPSSVGLLACLWHFPDQITCLGSSLSHLSIASSKCFEAPKRAKSRVRDQKKN